ncbi:MAG: PQQ-binding-like beta-propeller repeat protein [bacterium]
MKSRIILNLLLAVVAGSPILAADLSAEVSAKADAPDLNRHYSEAEAIRIGWPAMTGPYGNYQPVRTKIPIVDDLVESRLVWKSQGLRLGNCKSAVGRGSRPETHYGPQATSIPGSWASLIVADGKVFAASFRPVGEFFEIEESDAKGQTTKSKIRLDAEDVVVAVDFHTGKTVWTATEPGGILTGGGKRSGLQVTPVHAQGRVFAFGSTGRVFAYDAATGKKLWQGDIGPVHQKCAESREQILKKLVAGKYGRAMSDDETGKGQVKLCTGDSSMVVAEGVLVAPMFSDDAFRGFDAATGKVLWEKQNLNFDDATPSVFRSGGREYILSANMKGEMMLLDPKDGKELWKVTGLGVNGFTLSPSETHVMVNVNTKTGGNDAKTRAGCIWGCYRISPEKAELIWRMPDDRKYQFAAWYDCIAGHQETIRDGKFYYWALDVMNYSFIVEVATGKVLFETDKTVGGQQWYLLEDKIIGRINASHSNAGGTSPFHMWRVANDKIEELTGRYNPPDVAGGYTVLMQAPIVAGRMFERTQSGEIQCYDLRPRTKVATWNLEMRPASIGLNQIARPLTFFEYEGGVVDKGSSLPPKSEAVGMPHGSKNGTGSWEGFDCPQVKRESGRLSGLVPLNVESINIPVTYDLKVDDKGAVTGTWTRSVPATVVTTNSGKFIATAPNAKKFYPTGWLKDQPITYYGDNPAGTQTYVFTFEKFTPGTKPQNVSYAVDFDGKQVVRAIGFPGPMGQSWHEADMRGLKTCTAERIEGEFVLLLNRDKWFAKEEPNPGMAVKVRIEAKRTENGYEGTWQATWGEAYEFNGTANGRRVLEQLQP